MNIFEPIDGSEWPINARQILGRFVNDPQKLNNYINENLVGFAFDREDDLFIIVKLNENGKFCDHGTWQFFNYPDQDPIFNNPRREFTQLSADTPLYHQGDEWEKPRRNYGLIFAIVGIAVLFFFVVFPVLSGFDLQAAMSRASLQSPGHTLTPEAAVFECLESDELFPIAETESGLPIYDIENPIYPGRTYCVPNPETVFSIFTENGVKDPTSYDLSSIDDRYTDVVNLPFDAAQIAVYSANDIIQNASDTGDYELMFVQWDLPIYEAIIQWLLLYLEDPTNPELQYLNIDVEAPGMSESQISLLPTEEIEEGVVQILELPTSDTSTDQDFSPVSAPAFTQERAQEIIENTCSESENPHWCQENAWNEYLDGQEESVAAANQAALHFLIVPTDVPTPTPTLSANGFACSTIYTVTWDELTGNTSSTSQAIRSLADRLYVYEESLHDFNSGISYVWLQGYSPPSGGISSACVEITGTESMNINGRGNRWIISDTSPGVMIFGHVDEPQSMRIKTVTIYPVESLVTPTNYVSLYNPPTSTPAPNMPTATPRPTLERPPAPACKVISWNELITNTGETYNWMVSHGDTYLVNNGWVSDQGIGMQMEWIATTGTVGCYYVTGLPESVAVENEWSWEDYPRYGFWHPDVHGALICIDNPCLDEYNNHVGRYLDTNIYLFSIDEE